MGLSVDEEIELLELEQERRRRTRAKVPPGQRDPRWLEKSQARQNAAREGQQLADLEERSEADQWAHGALAAANTLGMGAADEARGGFAAVAPLLLGGFAASDRTRGAFADLVEPLSTGAAEALRSRPLADMGERYRRARDTQREASAQAAEENPLAYGTGELVGTLGPALLPTGGAAQAARAAGAKAGAKAGATVGGITGAAGGFAGGEGAWDSLKQMALGGALGTALGGGFGALGGLLPAKAPSAPSSGSRAAAALQRLTEGVSDVGRKVASAAEDHPVARGALGLATGGTSEAALAAARAVAKRGGADAEFFANLRKVSPDLYGAADDAAPILAAADAPPVAVRPEDIISAIEARPPGGVTRWREGPASSPPPAAPAPRPQPAPRQAPPAAVSEGPAQAVDDADIVAAMDPRAFGINESAQRRFQGAERARQVLSTIGEQIGESRPDWLKSLRRDLPVGAADPQAVASKSDQLLTAGMDPKVLEQALAVRRSQEMQDVARLARQGGTSAIDDLVAVVRAGGAETVDDVARATGLRISEVKQALQRHAADLPRAPKRSPSAPEVTNPAPPTGTGAPVWEPVYKELFGEPPQVRAETARAAAAKLPFGPEDAVGRMIFELRGQGFQAQQIAKKLGVDIDVIRGVLKARPTPAPTTPEVALTPEDLTKATRRRAPRANKEKTE